ncbi:hypothetical protein CDAR_54761 [Caerostris darwini]|uniref:Uncharacterized protein n=1 Tax=Caerostris darwini TaxID=1538125 RepID=A0AAV4RZS0_9ARAC|nr:hypothetical protein CDAR_54761 [Caerostris darwini]
MAHHHDSLDTNQQRNKRSSAEPEDSGDKTFTNDLGVICLFSHISRPRSRTTPSRFRRMLMACLLVRGNCGSRWLLLVGGDGELE